MTLEAGKRVGKYEIKELLGAGGMGEVYLAHDTELRRAAALKFLPAEVAADPKRLERFGREALAASGLNHPNIVTVYDIGQTGDGRRFIATEFVDGVTLRERVGSRGLKLTEALDLVAQAAAALVEAHGHGIVHRDIKPENLMLRRDGYVKVLDFGLAKLTGGPAPGVDTEAATRALAATDAGAVMGTVSYMSPEQSRGEDVDARTDVWSLGVVLYEMLTGHPPFRGRSANHTLVAIQDEEPPPLSDYLPEVPDLLQEVVADALSKDREARLTARQMLAKLQRLKRRVEAGAHLDHSVAPNAPLAVADTVSAGGAPAGSASRPGATASGGHATVAAAPAGRTQTTAGEPAGARSPRRLWAAGALALAALAGLGFGLYKFLGRGPAAAAAPFAPLQRMRFTKMPVSGEVREAFISPDGRFIARVFYEKGLSGLRLRQLGASSERDVVPPADVYFRDGATFSHDGNSLYYVVGETGKGYRTLYRVPVIGGDPQKLVEDVDSGVSLSPDGRRLAFRRYAPKEREDRLVVANEDGTGERVLAVRKAPAALGQPAWSPDGRLIAHAVYGRDDEGEYAALEATDASDGSAKSLSPTRWRYLNAPRWLPGGGGLVITGKPRSAATEEKGQLWFISFPGGEAQKVTNDANNYLVVSLTADGRTALVMQSALASNVWVVPAGDFARARQVTSSNSELNELCWAPDGRIVYSAVSANSRLDLWAMNADGTGGRQLTFTADRSEAQPALTPDGRHIVFQSVSPAGQRSIWRMGADGGGARELVRNVGQYAEPQVSPDSQWVFYNGPDEAGEGSFWKVPFEGGQPAKVWPAPCRLSPEGRRLVCFQRNTEPDAVPKAVVVPAEGGAPLRTLGWPREANALYWSPDGQGFEYIATREGVTNVWRMPLAGGREQKLTDWQTQAPLWSFAWSRDGRTLAVTRDTRNDELVLIQNFRD